VLMQLFSMAIDVISSLVVVFPILIILYFTWLKSLSLKKKILLFVFICYIIAVFSVVGIPSITGLTLDFYVNLVPFADMIAGLTETLLNVVLFIPMGFMLPLLWKCFCSLKKTVLFGFLVSAGIEILQIFTFRTTDINDLITNTAGTLLGYLLVIKICKKLFCDEDANARKEIICAFSLVFLTMFFVTSLISGVLWNIVLL